MSNKNCIVGIVRKEGDKTLDERVSERTGWVRAIVSEPREDRFGRRFQAMEIAVGGSSMKVFFEAGRLSADKSRDDKLWLNFPPTQDVVFVKEQGADKYSPMDIEDFMDTVEDANNWYTEDFVNEHAAEAEGAFAEDEGPDL